MRTQSKLQRQSIFDMVRVGDKIRSTDPQAKKRDDLAVIAKSGIEVEVKNHQSGNGFRMLTAEAVNSGYRIVLAETSIKNGDWVIRKETGQVEVVTMVAAHYIWTCGLAGTAIFDIKKLDDVFELYARAERKAA